MLAGETAPIIWLPWEKPELALSVSCAGKGRAAMGRVCVPGLARCLGTGHQPGQSLAPFPLDVTHSCLSLHGQHSPLPSKRRGGVLTQQFPGAGSRPGYGSGMWKELKFLLPITASPWHSHPGATPSLATAQGCQWP